MRAAFISEINDPGGRLGAFLKKFAGAAAGGRGRFALCLGATHTSDVPGVSAAGATPELRRFTPSIDAEALVLGRPLSSPALPVSPQGIVSPVVITRASLTYLDCPTTIVDCGCFQPPAVEHLSLGSTAARCLSSGCALDLEAVYQLFEKGSHLGSQLSSQADYLIVGECVPGGTTTALGVLTALGISANGLLSSSLPQADHTLRAQLVKAGLQRSGLSVSHARTSPLSAVAALGDPMQPVAAGLALAAAHHVPVMLAGGSQMLAVWALLQAMTGNGISLPCASNLAVVTTKWVAFDKRADCARLAGTVKAPFACACPDFHRSRHEGLRAYEQGNVKEGVGAGGLMAAAVLAGRTSPAGLRDRIDQTYDEMVLAQL